MSQQSHNRANANYHRPKKSMGQNFLRSAGVAKYMVKAARIGAGDVVLEVGPGKGVITKELLSAGARVVAVEKDRNLVDTLNKTFQTEVREKKLRVLGDDILKTTPKSLDLADNSFAVVANIPYFLTGALLRHFLQADRQPRLMILMVQKEVAERIVARDGKESILSISVKIYGDPKYLKTVKKALFSPKPKVDSAIISIDNISKDRLLGVDEKRFFEILKLGFSHKRKRLLKNLGGVISPPTSSCSVTENSRAENLTVCDWVCLSKYTHENRKITG